MRKLVATALVAAALLPLLTYAAASRESFTLRSAQDLADLCAVPSDDPMVEAAHGFCYGFLSGVGGYHRAITAGGKERPLFCLPAQRISRVEAAKMFVAWGQSHPQYLAEPAVDALIRFAVDTWPCPPAKG